MSEGVMNETLRKLNSEMAEKYNVPDGFIVSEINKDQSESIYLSELINKNHSKLCFKYKLRGAKGQKFPSFIISSELADKLKLPDIAKIKPPIKSDPHRATILFDSLKAPDALNSQVVYELLKSIVDHYISTFEPADRFGCCSKYKECSRAGKCLHRNLFYAKACWYRKNLESGNIFPEFLSD